MKKYFLTTVFVICLAGLLIAIALPNFIGAQDRAKISPVHVAPAIDQYSYATAPIPGTTELSGKEKLNTEDYDPIAENPFLETRKNPLSTFSIDVDSASYSNVRRFISEQRLPPIDAVRIEELINYFPYHYPSPTGEHPFSVSSSLSECPWNKKHHLLSIALKGKPVKTSDLPPSNLVFLLDVSGSMEQANKLPLVKSAMQLLTENLRPSDNVAIVVYAGAAGVVLAPTPGNQKETILKALDQLESGGSTGGAAGIDLAYQTAQKYFKPQGNNRIILATDGDFNLGLSSDAELVRLIETKRNEGIFLTVLGFGDGNYKDNKMEKLANQGNGNYAYIDTLREARKVLIEEMGSTLLTIAKDVKLQLEFNPLKIKSYRLIGYENRLLAAEDFQNDQKDAGEMGAGTTVTALYELIPADGSGTAHELKYQKNEVSELAKNSTEAVTVNLRYKQPQSNQSKLLKTIINDQASQWVDVSEDVKFSAAVAAFGMQLRQSKHLNGWGYDQILFLAKQNKGQDTGQHRQSFIALVEQAQEL